MRLVVRAALREHADGRAAFEQELGQALARYLEHVRTRTDEAVQRMERVVERSNELSAEARELVSFWTMVTAPEVVATVGAAVGATLGAAVGAAVKAAAGLVGTTGAGKGIGGGRG